MVNFNNLIDLQIEIFVLMFIGYILAKLNIITKESRKSLTDLVIFVVLPANIIYSFMIEMNDKIIKSGFEILIVSIVIQLLCSFLGKYFFIKESPRKQSVLKYGTICSNAGFMGSPLIQGLYGLNGLLFASIYLIPQRIVMWSGGVACLSMIVIGGILSEIRLKDVISGLNIYYTIIRLLVIPILVLFGCALFNVAPLVMAVSTVLAGMPAGSTTAILAEKYDGDSRLAVEIIFMSTAFSLITIPLLCILINMVVAR